MKRLIALLVCAALAVSAAACMNGGEPAKPASDAAATPTVTDAPTQAPAETAAPQSTQTPAPTPAPTPETPAATALVVYFSRSGNTEAVAMEIQSQTGADLFRIVPAEPYVDDYNALLDVAREEQRNNARPAIADSVENMDAYDTIYLGYPNWWGDMPMILYSFLDSYDLSDKNIAPFCTSGGSGLSRTVGTIQTMEPDATVLKGLHIEDSAVSRARGAVTHWLGELGITE